MAVDDTIMTSPPQAASPVVDEQPSTRWKYLDKVRTTNGPFTDPDIQLGPEVVEMVDRMKILVIGGGGLGCEILKNLALSGFKDIHVIDMDTIDISNLNRQFLFRKSDVGKSKAEVAARFVERRVKGVSITPHNCRIQDKDDDFYRSFQIVVSGLDSIEARRWINSKLIDLFDPDDPNSLIPLIDGGTEGFKGQSRVVLPTITSCIECQLDMHAPRTAVPLCTLASIPRQPEHCIEWAHIIAWEAETPFPNLDKDDPHHITWLYARAAERAQKFGIGGVTYALTQGVVKNIIPAIASTNAIIAASCCNEALKIATNAAGFLGPQDNYMMYSGNDSIYTFTFKHDRKPDCPVCGDTAKELLDIDPRWTLQEFLDHLAAHPAAMLKKASVRAEGKSLYMRSPAALEEKTRANLAKCLGAGNKGQMDGSDRAGEGELLTGLGLEDGTEVAVTDEAFPGQQFQFVLRWAKGR